jgi:transposase-like protein
LDAKVEKVRDPDGRVRRKALVVAHAVHEQRYRAVIALDVGATESKAFWREFLRSLVARGLSGVELVVSDQHEGLKKAIGQILGCPWQRCTVYFLREMLGHVHRGQQGMVAAALRHIFQAESMAHARAACRQVIVCVPSSSTPSSGASARKRQGVNESGWTPASGRAGDVDRRASSRGLLDERPASG